MKVEVTVDGKPYRSHAAGETFLVSPREAKLLVALKRVTYTTKDMVVEVPVTEPVAFVAATDEGQDNVDVSELPVVRSRQYRRRDLSAAE